VKGSAILRWSQSHFHFLPLWIAPNRSLSLYAAPDHSFTFGATDAACRSTTAENGYLFRIRSPEHPLAVKRGGIPHRQIRPV
jgi:hypothetical protein